MKTELINTRIEPALKSEAEAILSGLGLSASEAIRLFYRQICLHSGLPFEVKVPNETTLQALQDSRNRENLETMSVDEFFASLQD